MSKVGNTTRQAMERSPWTLDWLILLTVVCLAMTSLAADQREPLVLRSSRFVLHTDLPEAEAEHTLVRMEAALSRATEYWQQDSRRQIDCYVMRDPSVWPDSALPHKLARVWVGGVGGATISEFESDRGKRRVKATVYASAKRGIVEHEVVHAYCYQTFGEAGPDWYKEGMAQLVSQPVGGGPAGSCPRELAEGVRTKHPKRIQEITQAGRFTRDLDVSFGSMLADNLTAEDHVSMDDWNQGDIDTLSRMKEHYRWSWSLCHLLLHNSNYSTRFRMLGNQYLADGQASFDDAFAAVADELAFEYRLFLKHADAGYHVDLCRWDWHERFRMLDEQRTIVRRIAAARGFQASGLEVTAGHHYDYVAQGCWALSAAGSGTDADGQADGAGRMIGVVMSGFDLSESFELGTQGKFRAPSSGRLYVRCNDAWNQLDDNQGEITLRFSRPACPRK